MSTTLTIYRLDGTSRSIPFSSESQALHYVRGNLGAGSATAYAECHDGKDRLWRYDPPPTPDTLSHTGDTLDDINHATVEIEDGESSHAFPKVGDVIWVKEVMHGVWQSTDGVGIVLTCSQASVNRPWGACLYNTAYPKRRPEYAVYFETEEEARAHITGGDDQ